MLANYKCSPRAMVSLHNRYGNYQARELHDFKMCYVNNNIQQCGATNICGHAHNALSVTMSKINPSQIMHSKELSHG